MTNFVDLMDKTLGPDQKEAAKLWIEHYLPPRAITDRKYIADAKLALDITDFALVFPYLDLDGNPTGFYRYRLPDNGGWRQLKDSGVHLYIPPLKHKSLNMRKVLADPKYPLVIAEGETRALVLNRHGIPSVAIGGIHCYKKDGQLISDIARIPMKERIVNLAFDHDVTVRRDLQDPVMDLAQRLADLGADVRLVPTPMVDDELKTGADDFVAKHGIAEFKKLLKDARSHRHPDFAAWGSNGVKLDLTLAPIGTDWLDKKPPAIEFTWDKYLPRGSTGLLIAEGGTGKTYLAQALAQAIAGGIPFLGLQTRQGIAVHIAFEEVPDELRRRQYAIYQNSRTEMRESGISKAKIDRFAKALSQNLFLKSVVGQELHIAVMDGSNVVQGKALDALIYQLRELGDIELVIIDPLSRAHSIDSESQAWGTVIINACERIALEVGCTVLVTHHTGKGKEREDLYSARGASALADAARVVLRLKEATLDDVKYVANVSDDDVHNHRLLRLINAKLSYGPRQPDIWLYRTPDGVLTSFVPSMRGTATFKGKLDELYKFATQTKQDQFSRTLIRNNRKEIFDDNSISDHTVRKLLDDAIQQGTLIESREQRKGTRLLQFSENFKLGVPK